MAYNKFDPRLESLVMESRTHWDPDVQKELSEDDQRLLSEALHREPAKASKIEYVRSHTGFAREITVTLKDIERLYAERLAES